MNISIIGQPPDGSCFFHAIIAALDTEVLGQTRSVRAVRVNIIRSNLSQVFSKDILPAYMLENLIVDAQVWFVDNKILYYLKDKDVIELEEVATSIGLKFGKNEPKIQLKNRIKENITIDNIFYLLKEKPYTYNDWIEYTVKRQKNRIKQFCLYSDNISILMMLCYVKHNIIIIDHDTGVLRTERVINKRFPYIVLDYKLNVHYELYCEHLDGGGIQTTFSDDSDFITEIRTYGGLTHIEPGYIDYIQDD